jgi:hypothetical protein
VTLIQQVNGAYERVLKGGCQIQICDRPGVVEINSGAVKRKWLGD